MQDYKESITPNPKIEVSTAQGEYAMIYTPEFAITGDVRLAYEHLCQKFGGVTATELAQKVAEARLDEQQRTGRLKYRPGDGELVFFQPDGSTFITQDERLKQLEAQLNPQKPGEGEV